MTENMEKHHMRSILIKQLFCGQKKNNHTVTLQGGFHTAMQQNKNNFRVRVEEAEEDFNELKP